VKRLLNFTSLDQLSSVASGRVSMSDTVPNFKHDELHVIYGKADDNAYVTYYHAGKYST
jgi:hypothetical protein